MALALVTAALYIGTTLAVGALALRFLVITRSGLETAERLTVVRRSAAWGAAGALIALASTPGRAIVQARGLAFPGDPWWPAVYDVVTGTALGSVLLVQAAAALLADLAFVVARRDHPLAWIAALPAVLVLAMMPGLTGHPAASDSPALLLTAAMVHVLAAGAWVGTLFHLWRHVHSPSAGVLIARFHPVALSAATLLAASGAIQTWSTLTAPGDLIGTRWGTLLLAKLALVGATMLFGYRHWRGAAAQLARRDREGLARSLGAETGIALLVLLITGMLATSAPPE